MDYFPIKSDDFREGGEDRFLDAAELLENNNFQKKAS